MNWCWIIPIIVGLITALLGYLLGRWSRQRDVNEWQAKYEQERENVTVSQRKISLLEHDVTKAQESEKKLSLAHTELTGRFELLQHQWDKNRTEIQNLKDENKKLEGRLADCLKRSSKSNDARDQMDPSKKPDTDQSPKLVFDAAAAQMAFGKSIEADDLTMVEGIGPKIQELFHNHGIKTWYALSKCSEAKCQDVLDSGGTSYTQHKPKTWPRQASLAFEGKWEELKKWQDELDGGV